ncbi:glycosyltransferase [Ruminococcus albus]|uniref:glycosyltransferase n=1 Tax=Ruminococcus albus TaxID=1264 RepID=UPI0004BC9B36|nr:glycosyltransferase [Ruminococcus albus]
MTIVTPSKWLAGLVKRSFLKRYPVEVIHNGIDTSQFYPMESDFRERYGIENRFILLGVASSWNEMKGLSDYFKLAKKLDDSYRVVLVGLSKDQLKSVPQNMICIERTNSTEELAQIYSASDVLLNLSYCENYPTVNLEAIACGTPVITYNTGGSPESNIENDGAFINKGNLEGIIDQIKNLQNHDCEKKRMKVDTSSFDKMKTTLKYMNIYC